MRSTVPDVQEKMHEEYTIQPKHKKFKVVGILDQR